MKKTLFALFLIVITFCLSVAAQKNLAGDWAGGSNLFPSRPGFIQARFERTKTGFGGFFNAQGWDAAKREITNVRVESSKIHFEFPSAAGTPFVADGELKDGVIQGTITRGEDKGKFHLVRLGEVNPQTYQSLVGAYEIEKNNLNLITWGAFGHLRVINFKEGGSDALLPLGGDKFILGRSIVNSTVPSEVVTFTRNEKKEVSGFTLHSNGKLIVSAPKTEWYNQEQVQFYNGKVKLVGTVFTPRTNLKHSAAVWIHGSQDRGRDDTIPFIVANGYLQLGIAFLVFDKRGVGASNGDWHTASFEDLAEDALAGVRYLRKRNDINDRQIGLEGVSQGGWIAPIAAARDSKIAFMILISAAGVSSAEQVEYDHLVKLRAAGLSEEELKEAAAFNQLQLKAMRSREGWAQYQAVIPDARNKKWFSRIFIPKESWRWESTVKTAFFEPAPTLRKIKCPVLMFFGGDDPNYPARKSAEIMERALREGGNRDVTVKIFEGANHSLLVRQPDGRFVPAPDPDNTKYNWLIKRVNVDF